MEELFLKIQILREQRQQHLHFKLKEFVETVKYLKLNLEREGIVAFNHECNIEYVNPEVTTLTAKNVGSLSYESYVNRNRNISSFEIQKLVI